MSQLMCPRSQKRTSLPPPPLPQQLFGWIDCQSLTNHSLAHIWSAQKSQTLTSNSHNTYTPMHALAYHMLTNLHTHKHARTHAPVGMYGGGRWMSGGAKPTDPSKVSSTSSGGGGRTEGRGGTLLLTLSSITPFCSFSTSTSGPADSSFGVSARMSDVSEGV